MPSSYFPLDVNFFDHPKVVPLGDTTLRMHLSAIGYANRLMTDGFIARPIPGRLVEWDWTDTDAPTPRTCIDELVAVVLWHPAGEPCPRGHDETCPKLDGDGWRIHDFLEHNRSRDARLASQEAERDRKAAWRKRQRDAAVPRDMSVPGDAGLRHTGDVTGTGNTETETETETNLRPSAARVASATPATITPIPTAQTFVAAYVDAYRGRAGHDPPSRVKGQLAKELAKLIDDGIPPDAIKAGFVEWFELDKHPSTLASFVEANGRGGKPRPRTRSQERQQHRDDVNREMAAWAAEMEGGGDATDRVDSRRGGVPRSLPRPGLQ